MTMPSIPDLTLTQMLRAHARERPDALALRQKDFGIWQAYSWHDYYRRARHFGLGLRAMGLEPGGHVAIISENRVEWVIGQMGIGLVQGICVGVYPTSPWNEVAYVLEHSDAEFVICEDQEQTDKVLEAWPELPKLKHCIAIDMKGLRYYPEPPAAFEDIEARGREFEKQHPGLVDELLDSQQMDDTALMIYTSGSTGRPKGAMISWHNLHAAAPGLIKLLQADEHGSTLSYLPLCHVAEQAFTNIAPVYVGSTVSFGESLRTIQEDLREIAPTFFLGVPRIWEKMLAAIRIKGADASWLKRRLLNFWLDQGVRLERRRQAGTYGPHHRLWYGLGWLLVYRPLRQRLGMNRVRVAFSGAAPIAPEVLEAMRGIGIPVVEGYAMTENTAMATATMEGDIRRGSVGVALPNSEVRIADDGEVLTRSDATFLGYFKNPEATAETIVDGWLHTGDIGRIDEHGHLYITDRKKDIIITAGGKNISPSEIENRLKVSPYVREAIVIGDGRKYLTALIGIEGDTVGDWATRRRIPYTTYEDLTTKDEVRELVQGVVDRANLEFAQVETVKYVELLPIELDHEDGQLTATQKVKRSAITEQFGDLIEGMYE